MCLACLDGELTPAGGRSAPPGDADRALVESGERFLAKHATLDIHAHPGRFFLTGETSGTRLAADLGEPFVAQAIADMRAARLAGVIVATVADHVLLEATDRGLRAVREFRPGEAYADHQRQVAVVAQFADGDRIRLAGDAAGVRAAHRDDATAVLLSIEGGDFVEDRIDRIARARAAGVRSITIIHYHVNRIGDTQTEAPVHGGITPFGREVVRTMERAGIVVDLTHASAAVCEDVARLATKPFIMSHSNLRRAGQDHPRLVDYDQARLVAESGGVLGAVPAGFNQRGFGDYIDTVCDMAGRLGVDHVAIGSDMDYTFRPVLDTYRLWPTLAGSLLHRGISEGDVAKIMGGNMMRLLDAAD